MNNKKSPKLCPLQRADKCCMTLPMWHQTRVALGAATTSLISALDQHSQKHTSSYTPAQTHNTPTHAHTHTHTRTPTHMHTHTERDDTYNMYVHMYTCTVHITTGAYACVVTHLHMVIGRMYSHSLLTILLWACSLGMYMRQEAHKWSRKDMLSVSLSAITDIS